MNMSDIFQWHGTGGVRASNQLAQWRAPGHLVSWTPVHIMHLNPARDEAGSQAAGSASQVGGNTPVTYSP